MGTAANLAIHFAGKSWVEHTSYDGSKDNVFAYIGASIAACGLDALRQAIANTKVKSVDISEDDEEELDQARAANLQLSAANYLAACQARGKQPFGLFDALRDPFNGSDFAHAGVLGLMGPAVMSDTGWGEGDFFLDLDAGVLRYEEYASFDMSANKPETVLVMDLAQLENLDPEQVFLAIQQMRPQYKEDISERRVSYQAALDEALAKAQAGHATRPDYFVAPNEQEAGPVVDRGEGAFEPGVHVFRAHYQNGPALRLVISLLQRLGASRLPALARPGVIVANTIPEDDNSVSATVDLSKGFADESEGRFTHATLERLSDQVANLGMSYDFQSKNSSSRRFRGGGMVSVSIGFDDDDSTSSLAAPAGSTPVRTPDVRLRDAVEDAQSPDKEASDRLVFEKVMALAQFDGAMLAAIPESITLSKDQENFAAELMLASGRVEDLALPGARRERFMALPVATRSQILGSLSNLQRYMLTEELNLTDTDIVPERSSLRP